MIVRPSVLAALAPVVLVALVACSGSPSSGAGTPVGSGQAVTPSVSAAPGGSATPGVTAALPELASGTTADGKTPLRITVNRFRAEGDLLELTWSVENTGTGATGGKWQVAGFFADGIYQPEEPEYKSPDGLSADGVYLLDRKNAKRYLVARDPHGVCVCSGNTASTFVSPGMSVPFTATFKAPPPDVTGLTVVIPKTAAFENVPVER